MDALPRHVLWRQFLAIALLVIVAAWAIAFVHVRDVRDSTWTEAEARVIALARVHGEQAALTLTIAEELLHHLQQTAVTSGHEAFRREAARLSGRDAGGPINRVTLFDAEGKSLVNYRDGQPDPPFDIGDRPYFQTLRNVRDNRVVVTEPIAGRQTGEQVILFALPMPRDAQFSGAVIVGLPTKVLERSFDTVTTESEVVTLLSAEGRIIARTGESARFIGTQIQLAPIPEHTPTRLKSPLDGAERLAVQRQLPGWGLRVIAGIDVNVLEREIDAHAGVAFLPAALLTLLLLPATVIARKASRLQQQADAALQTEIRRSRRVLEGIHEGALLIDAKGLISFANRAASAWLPECEGKTFPEALKDAGLTMVTEDGMPFVGDDPIALLCLQMGQDFDGAWLRRGEDDRHSDETWLAVSVRTLCDDDGLVVGVTVTLSDRSADHERLTESALTEDILNNMHDAVMITDGRGIIVRVNPAFSRMTGFSSSEAIGQTPRILNSGRHDTAFHAELWSTLLRDGHWSGRIWNRNKRNEEYCCWHSITSIRNLRGQIVRFISVSRDITEQEAKETELWQQANFDALTGLANRSRFNDRLNALLSQARRDGRRFAVCYLDLDRFKPVNDTLGHAAGDTLLRQAAQRMRSMLREEDMLARIGGDEFALLLPDIAGEADAAHVAGKIIDALKPEFVLAEGAASIGISVGIAIYPEHGDSAEALQTSADRALYEAKANGRSRWCLAGIASTPATDETIHEPSHQP